MGRSKLLSEVEKYAKIKDPKFPTMDYPLETTFVTEKGKSKTKVENLFVGHVRMSKQTGIFMELGHNDSESALEDSANYVAEFRRNYKLSGKF